MKTTLGRRIAGFLRSPILYHVDAPATETCAAVVHFQGWAVSRQKRPIRLFVEVAGGNRWEVQLDQHRPDVVDALADRVPGADARCGFSFWLDATVYRAESPVAVALEFHDGRRSVRAPCRRVFPDPAALTRAQYKSAWNACSGTAETAMRSIWGSSNPEQFRQAGQDTRDLLQECVAIRPQDVILEIGAGIGRVGEALAPLCQEWIGADVSENMLVHLRRRLAGFANVRAVALTGYDLGPIPSASIDVVYCTVVFPHLDEWDRYNYVREGFRVLKPGGRMLVDNFNLLSDEGWQVFEECRSYHPLTRSARISKSSTPQELEAYFRRAGFENIRQKEAGVWIITYASKPG